MKSTPYTKWLYKSSKGDMWMLMYLLKKDILEQNIQTFELMSTVKGNPDKRLFKLADKIIKNEN